MSWQMVVLVCVGIFGAVWLLGLLLWAFLMYRINRQMDRDWADRTARLYGRGPRV